jgi:hypothetical protein
MHYIHSQCLFTTRLKVYKLKYPHGVHKTHIGFFLFKCNTHVKFTKHMLMFFFSIAIPIKSPQNTTHLFSSQMQYPHKIHKTQIGLFPRVQYPHKVHKTQIEFFFLECNTRIQFTKHTLDFFSSYAIPT